MNKYFQPPPEARYLDNRNINTAKEGHVSAVGEYEQPLEPADINLDSTRCTSNFDPPLTLVSIYVILLGPHC